MAKYKGRTLFLHEFTKQLILNSMTQEQIYINKISPRYFSKPQQKTKPEQEYTPSQKIKKQKQLKKPKTYFEKIKSEIQHPKPRLKIKQLPRSKKAIQPGFNQNISNHPSQSHYQVNPSPTNLPQDFNLGKIQIMIQDPRVTMIECPGPNKNIMVKTGGNMKISDLSLTEKEIQDIIDKFSKQTKVPVISGIFKAAVGNLMMTATISSTGNSFMITKITPRFIIEQNQQNNSHNIKRNFNPNILRKTREIN